MQKYLAAALVVPIVFSASTQGENASTYTPGEQVANLSVQPDGLPSNTMLKMRADNRKDVEPITRSEVAPTLPSTGPISVSYADVDNAAAYPNPQTSPTSTHQPPTHHSHFLRTFIIVFALGAVLLLGLAAAAK